MYWKTLAFLLDYQSSILIGILVLLTLYFYRSTKQPKNFPPGPRGIPLLGYTPFIGDNAAETFQKMKGKYGPVMSVRFGRQDWIILNDYDTINQAFVKQGDVFSGRPKNLIFEMMTQGYGLAPADYGQTWQRLRKFGVTTLRGFGVGKKGMEQNLIEETPFLIDALTSESGLPLQKKLTRAVSNIICRVAFGSRFSYDDKKFHKLLKMTGELFSDGLDAQLFGFMALVPALRFVPPFKGALKRLSDGMKEFIDIADGIIADHEAHYDENDLGDFIYAFLKEMKARGENDPTFHAQQLVQYIRDLFQAGTSTTSSTIYWAILCFANYPEYQEKMFKEIDDVLGDSGIPTMKHRDEMPFTCAFLQELMRHRTLLPLGGFHKTSKQTTLCGFSIPAETTVLSNLWAVHFDPCNFEDPTVFRPERFLDEDGKFIKSNHVIPFSVGPRHCLGEHLARMEVFIFLTGIVQKLKVVPDPSKPVPKFENGTYINLSSYEAPQFDVNFETR